MYISTFHICGYGVDVVIMDTGLQISSYPESCLVSVLFSPLVLHFFPPNILAMIVFVSNMYATHLYSRLFDVLLQYTDIL